MPQNGRPRRWKRVGVAAAAVLTAGSGTGASALMQAAPATAAEDTNSHPTLHLADADDIVKALAETPTHVVTVETTTGPKTYKVVFGDTLSGIAARFTGSAANYPHLAQINNIPNPNLIFAGATIIIDSGGPTSMNIAIADPPPPPKPPVLPDPPDPPPPVVHAAVAAPVPPPPPPPIVRRVVVPASFGMWPGAAAEGMPSIFDCIVKRESGGNPGAVNASSGAGGWFQFLPSTWRGLGFAGLPQNASEATQVAAAKKQYAASGTAAWSPYDGCR